MSHVLRFKVSAAHSPDAAVQRLAGHLAFATEASASPPNFALWQVDGDPYAVVVELNVERFSHGVTMLGDVIANAGLSGVFDGGDLALVPVAGAVPGSDAPKLPA